MKTKKILALLGVVVFALSLSLGSAYAQDKTKSDKSSKNVCACAECKCTKCECGISCTAACTSCSVACTTECKTNDKAPKNCCSTAPAASCCSKDSKKADQPAPKGPHGNDKPGPRK